MLNGMTQKQPVPDELLVPLVDCDIVPVGCRIASTVICRQRLRLVAQVLSRDEVLEARREIFTRLQQVGEVQLPAEEGIATGTSQRKDAYPDLGSFWKSVSEGARGPATCHSRVSTSRVGRHCLAAPLDLTIISFFVRLRSAMRTNLHYDYPFFAGGSSKIVTCWFRWERFRL